MIERTGIKGGQGASQQYLSIHELLKKQEPIWVINNSEKVKGQPLYVLISISESRTSPGRTIPIPPGPDPVCLTELVPFDELKKSDSLFQSLSSGLLVLISPQEAEEYYRKNPKRRDIVRMKMASFDAGTEAGSVGLGRIRSVIRKERGAGEVQQRSSRGDALPRVKWLVESYKEGTVSKDYFISEIATLSDQLEPVDIGYIKANLGEEARDILSKAGVE